MNQLRTHILDVGRADSIILELPSADTEHVMGIIDCSSFPRTKQYIMDHNIHPDRVQFVVATHPHGDHIKGLPDLLKWFKSSGVPVELFLDSGYEGNAIESYILLTNHLVDNADTIITSYVRTGAQFNLGQIKLRILSPPDPLITGTRSDCNNASVVVSLRYKKSRLLFAADAELPNWANVCVHQRRWMRAQVLKVSHHGSKWGTFFEALDVVKPKCAIISGPDSLNDSAGEYPHSLTKQSLELSGATIYCTKDHGNIQIESNANAQHIVTYSSM